MASIEPACGKVDGGWRCTVTVSDDASTSTHEVTVSDDDAVRLAAATDEGGIERLLYETFDFLLEREPKESILSTFDVSVIGGYFPEFERVISRGA